MAIFIKFEKKKNDIVSAPNIIQVASREYLKENVEYAPTLQKYLMEISQHRVNHLKI